MIIILNCTVLFRIFFNGYGTHGGRTNVVLKEISNIMGLEKVNTNTPGWFEHQMLATQKNLDNMMDDEKKALRRKGEEMRKNGMPEELQRK